jgi:peptide deformylase
MSVRDILKMGDERLLRVAQPVTAFNTPELHALLKDLDDTMLAANGAGSAGWCFSSRSAISSDSAWGRS